MDLIYNDQILYRKETIEGDKQFFCYYFEPAYNNEREERLVFRAFPLLILCLWLFSCSTSDIKDKYEYEKGLEWYLNEEFKIKMESIDIENLLDISCEDCMASKVSFLSNQKIHKKF